MAYLIFTDLKLNKENEFVLIIYFRDNVDIFRFEKTLDVSQVGIVIKDLMNALQVDSLKYIIDHGVHIICGIKYDKEDIIPATHQDAFSICKKFWISTDGEDWLYLNGGE